MSWFSRIAAVLGLLVVGWALVTEFPAIVHGHPAYAVMLLVTVLGCFAGLWRHRQTRAWVTGWRRAVSIALALGTVIWLIAAAWLRPYGAAEPALTAMTSDEQVTVEESATRIVLEPTGSVATTGVLFQPGAKVEARAYAAILRPLAEAGFRVVIVKQPFALAVLAPGAFDSAREDYPSITSWIVGGHSLGGTVAAMEADDHDSDGYAPVRGLLLYASYPASDISTSLTASVLSVSGTHDGLATPEDIDTSRSQLPADSRFTVVEGAVHSSFGDYGPQRGDGEPTIGKGEARTQISNASLAFTEGVAESTIR